MAIARLLGAPAGGDAVAGAEIRDHAVAMGIAEQIGGQPSLAAVFVLGTGLIGVMIGPPLLRLAGVRDWRARGLAAGTAAHGIATARISAAVPRPRVPSAAWRSGSMP